MTLHTTPTGAIVWRVALSCLFVTVMFHSANAETRYFKVAEWPGLERLGDSFVLPLTDPAAITHAEDLISLGPDVAGGTIPVCLITPGADGINRDFNQKDAPPWSWHVTEFQGFADFTIELIDGNPTTVENDVPWWMNNTDGQIGFWSYTVVEDVTHQVPEPSSMLLLCIGAFALIGMRRRKRN